MGCDGFNQSTTKDQTSIGTTRENNTQSVPINYNYTYPNNLLPSSAEDEYGFEFFPIGFSPEGHFAYINRPCNGGCGCCTHEIIVQDLLTDKVQMNYNLNRNTVDEQAYFLENWKQEYTNIKRNLIMKGISQSELFLERNKIFYDKRGKHKFEISVSKRRLDEGSYTDTSPISYAVYVTMDGVKTKKITYGKFSDAIDFEYLGFIRSPFSDQLAVVFNKKWYGFEAEKTNEIIVVGCSLEPRYY